MNFLKLTGPVSINLGSYIAANWQNVTLDRVQIICDSALGVINIALPRVQDIRGKDKLCFTIDDVTGSAATNNIVITPGSGDKINANASSYTLDQNYQKALLNITRDDETQTSGNWLALTNKDVAGTGTVTSMSSGGLSPLFTAAVATATTTPALSFEQITKAANLIFAGPASGAVANPDFRRLVMADMPTSMGWTISREPASKVLDGTATTWIYTGAGGHTFTLPTMAVGTTNTIYFIKNGGTGVGGTGRLVIDVTGGGSTIYSGQAATASLTLLPGWACIVQSDGTYWEVLPVHQPAIVKQFETNGTYAIPAGFKIDSIVIENTTANAVTGGIRIGTTGTGTEVVVAQAVGANALLQIMDADVLLKVFSVSASTTLFIEAVTAWNSAILNVYFVLKPFYKQ